RRRAPARAARRPHVPHPSTLGPLTRGGGHPQYLPAGLPPGNVGESSGTRLPEGTSARQDTLFSRRRGQPVQPRDPGPRPPLTGRSGGRGSGPPAKGTRGTARSCLVGEGGGRMIDDRVVGELEHFLAERADHLMRTAVLLTGSHEAGQDLLQ